MTTTRHSQTCYHCGQLYPPRIQELMARMGRDELSDAEFDELNAYTEHEACFV